MNLKINPHSLEWWAWTITFIALLIGLAGQKGGFEAAVAISLVQSIWFATSRGTAAFSTQIRYVYFVLTVIAYFDPCLSG